jgi:hypothetical protein
MTEPHGKSARDTAARLAVRRGEFVQLRRRILGQTWFWAAAFVVLGTALVTPRAAQRYLPLKSGEVAPTDIVVVADVTLPDTQATEESRRRASLEILPVYAWDPAVAEAARGRVERLLRESARGGNGDDEALAERLTAIAGTFVRPAEAALLRRLASSEDVVTVLLDLVGSLYRQGIVADRTELLQNGDRGVTLRTPEGSERVERDVYRFFDGGSALAEVIDQRLAAEGAVPRSARVALARLLAPLLPANISLNRGETLSRRLRAAGEVEEVSLRLPRGRVLVRRGDEVTPQAERILAALANRGESGSAILPAIGVFLLLGLLAGLWYFFLQRQSPSGVEFHARFGGVVMLFLLTLFLQRGFAFLAESVAVGMMREPFGHVELYLPALPHAAGPILAALMYGLPSAVFFAVMQGVVLALMLGGDASVVILSLTSGFAAAFASQRLKERNVLARVGVVVALVNALVLVGLALWRGHPPEGPVMVAQLVAGGVSAVVAAALAGFMLPAMESLTGTITDIRLLELSNPNRPLLKRLALEAPGTFQHSLAMANLAEAAAESVGANPLLARVCCYYHDIGKLAKPEYFVENQRGDNPHDNLTPWMSSLVVSNHVKAGLELARQYRLPEPMREAITTHHGNKLIRYFFSRAKEQESPDRGSVGESEFRYPGPRPRSKEMGILLLADAVEAASRTIDGPTPGRLQSMIDKVVKDVLEDGQLDDCDLTLKDIERIGAAFFWVLSNAFHQRIDYPGFEFNQERRG